MPELERVYAAFDREERAHHDLATYRRNVRIRQIEPDDDHERGLRAEIEAAKKGVDEAIAERRALVREQIAAATNDDLYVPTEAGIEAVRR